MSGSVFGSDLDPGAVIQDYDSLRKVRVWAHNVYVYLIQNRFIRTRVGVRRDRERATCTSQDDARRQAHLSRLAHTTNLDSQLSEIASFALRQRAGGSLFLTSMLAAIM